MARFAIVACLVLCVCCTVTAQEDMKLDQLIKPAEQKMLGLHKLTAAQREKLRVLLNGKMAEAFRLGQAQAIQANPGVQKAVAPNAGAPPAGRYAGVGSGHWVRENIDRGSMFLLEDGSLWQVDRLERLDASLWLKMTNISVVEVNGGMLGFDYLLINTDDGEKVRAKYLGKQ